MYTERESKERLTMMAEGLSHLVQRWDIFPQQLSDGRYVTVRTTLTTQHIASHLQGWITLGLYVLDTNNQAQFTVLDADDDENFKKIIGAVKTLNFPTYLERSRRGGHLWMFFESKVNGGQAKRFGENFLERFDIQAEVFPKQARSEVGSLVRMPFGVHRKSGCRYMFINPDLSPLGTWEEQLKEISNPKMISLTFLPPTPEQKPTREFKPPEQFANLNLIDFIGNYVELRRTPSGAIGHCPFHDDEHASFSIHEKGNYWHCFAGCGGGTVINFWMKLKGCSYREALNELRQTTGGKNEFESEVRQDHDHPPGG